MGNERTSDTPQRSHFAVQPVVPAAVGAIIIAASFAAFVSYAWVPGWSWQWWLWHGMWAAVGAGGTLAVAMLRLPYSLRVAELAVMGGSWFLWQPAGTPTGAVALVMPFIGWAAAVYCAAPAPSFFRPQYAITEADDIQSRLDEYYFDLYVYGARRRQQAPRLAARRSAHLLVLLVVAWATAPMYGIGFSGTMPGPAVVGLAGFLLGTLMWLSYIDTNSRLFAWQTDGTMNVATGLFRRWGIGIGTLMSAVVIFALLAPADISPTHRIDWDTVMTRLTQRIFSGNLMDLARSRPADNVLRPVAVPGFMPGGGGGGLALGTIVLVLVVGGIFSWTLWRLAMIFAAREGMRTRRLRQVLVFLLLWPWRTLSRWIRFILGKLRAVPASRTAAPRSRRDARVKAGRQSKTKRPPRAMHTVRQLFRALVERAARADMPRRPHTTAREFTERLGNEIPEVHDALENVARTYEYVRYAPRPVMPRDRLSFIRRQWRQVMEALK